MTAVVIADGPAPAARGLPAEDGDGGSGLREALDGDSASDSSATAAGISAARPPPPQPLAAVPEDVPAVAAGASVGSGGQQAASADGDMSPAFSEVSEEAYEPRSPGSRHHPGSFAMRRRSSIRGMRASLASSGDHGGRRKSRWLSKMRSREFTDAESCSHSGILTDFLLRQQKEVRILKSLGESPLEHLLKTRMFQDRGSVESLDFAMSLLKQEEMRHQLMVRITRESKELGAFKPNSAADFRRWVWKITENRQEVVVIRRKVKAWRFTWRLLHTTPFSVPESLWEKKGRLEDYWSTFHDRSQVVMNSAIVGGGFAGGSCVGSPTVSSASAQALGGFFEGSPMSRPGSRGGGFAAGGASPGAWSQRPSLASPAPSCGLSWDFKESIQWKTSLGSFGGSRPGTGSSQRLPRPTSLPNLKGLPATASRSSPGGAWTRGSTGVGGGEVLGFGFDDGDDPMGATGSGSRPSSSSSRRGVLPPLDSSKKRYLQECDGRKQPPRPLALLMGQKSLDLAGKDFVDAELLAVAATVKSMGPIEGVNLCDNSLLTDRSLVQLLRHLAREPLVSALRRFHMARCVKAGSHTIDATVGLLKAGSSLRVLNLSSVPVPTRFQLPLCQAIGTHPCLESVNLAETGLQHHEMTKQCLQHLLSSRTVAFLDLSWNSFNGEVFKALGGFVINNDRITKLRVSNCATVADTCNAEDFVPPLSLFLEQLAYDKTLKLLDISMNACDYRTALILEDALDTHASLKEIRLGQNPLGAFGLRSILRLVCRDHTGLEVFDTEGCYLGGANRDGKPVYSFTNPGGKYMLQLWRPYHRTLLRMLYKAMDYFKLAPEEAFDKIAYKVKGRTVPWKHSAKDDIGIWQVPNVGDVALVFNVQTAILKRFMEGADALDDRDSTGFLEGFYDTMRFKPSVRKVIPLFARWNEVTGDALAQEVFMNALSKDFNISMPYLEYMCEANRSMTSDLIWRLLPLVPGGLSSAYRIGHFFPTLSAFSRVHMKMRNFISMNVENPTGRYDLDLANCSDFAVAERIFLLDRWEAAIDAKHDRKDVSCWGNRSHVRNEMYQGRNLLGSGVHSVSEWQLPEQGSLSFDFVSNMRPSRQSQVLSQELWETILVELYQAECDPSDKIAAMRSISHCFHLQCSHVRAMMGYFKTPEDRVNVLVTFYMRIVDMHNAKMFRVRFDDQRELQELQRRLGYASFFPFLQPENATFKLDLSKFDQRLCACMYVQLAIKEKYPQNLHEYGYERANGVEDPMVLGVPRSWGDFKTIPTEGVFRATYRCSPEDRNFAFRRELANTYGFFDVDGLRDSDVAWWTGLTEPPEDVLRLLEFLISRVKNIEEAFIKIDGVGGNGSITLRELFEGLEEMDCHKFDAKKGQKSGLTKDQRIEAIFRYLDPGGEGSVSRQEWAILEQLWKEVDLSIREFVHFLMLGRTGTFDDCLRDAWDDLDADQSGELDEEEWLCAVEQIGYFGPARIVFALLDNSDDGNVSFDEFAVLERYKPKRFEEDAEG